MFGYPKKVEYWSTSDGKCFHTEEEAKGHEKFLDVLAEHPEMTVNCSSNNPPYDGLKF